MEILWLSLLRFLIIIQVAKEQAKELIETLIAELYDDSTKRKSSIFGTF